MKMMLMLVGVALICRRFRHCYPNGAKKKKELLRWVGYRTEEWDLWLNLKAFHKTWEFLSMNGSTLKSFNGFGGELTYFDWAKWEHWQWSVFILWCFNFQLGRLYEKGVVRAGIVGQGVFSIPSLVFIVNSLACVPITGKSSRRRCGRRTRHRTTTQQLHSEHQAWHSRCR